MAYTTINKSTDYFNTKLYTGNGSTQSISSVGFQPDWVWFKNRSSSQNHRLFDAVRGAGKNLKSNDTTAEIDAGTGTSGQLRTFDSDGFSVGSDGSVNNNGENIVAWNWKAGTTGSGYTTGTGTAKAYSYSVNTTAGFSIVKYTGNGSAGQQIPHHLGAVPHFILLKPLDRADNWRVYHHKLDTSSPANYQLKLNVTNAKDSGSDVWNNTIPTSTYFTLGSNAGVVANDEDFIAYCFTEKTGYSKFGSYTANDQDYPNSPFIYTGFKPQFLLIKNIVDATSSSDWVITDNKRPGYNPTNKKIFANESQAEATDEIANLLSNGFKLDNSTTDLNYSTRTYIYAAFGQSLVGSNNVPCTAR